ncbi:hypothetical protein CTM97_18555 [Photobacterium phosphoreum]|uniref:Uncharacterized protein n=1 Tax=Photobacterium phosphoreum TaxID=659 RepID=A0A2T3JBR9_PHOPO|nr:hypothetical protein [Photobacterium phosphoreum]PSU19940.1 hypothetical protein CTM96_20535 [Photobacterium phosphoreum]PSU38789.1 hypothetical protein CTM97_18555 [Photobacterium phosphoreum]PSU46288.1 hypothetical protein C9J18_20695 [Photobacterium phosphoreum]
MTNREIRIIGADTFDKRVAAIAAIEKHGERSGHIIHTVKSGGIWHSIEVHVFKCVIAEVVTKRAFKLPSAQTGSFING